MEAEIAMDSALSPSQARLKRRVVRVCEATGEFIAWWGFKSIHGRIWALLALSRDPVSQAEISRTLGVSRALVSGAIAELLEFGLVRPRSDNRLAPYEAVMDIWPVIADVMRRREWMLVERARVSLEAAVEEAEVALELEGDMPYDLDRMRLILGLTEMAQAFMKILMALRVPRSLDAMTGWLGRASRLTARFTQMG
jgi:DNA-binding transcriptional regulator GbsR (MarR family)